MKCRNAATIMACFRITQIPITYINWKYNKYYSTELLNITISINNIKHFAGLWGDKERKM